MLPPAAREFYSTQQNLAQTTGEQVRAAWQRHMGDDFDNSWKRAAPVLLTHLWAAQAEAAKAANTYAATAASAQGVDLVTPLAVASLVGVASNGSPLESLLHNAVGLSKRMIGRGASTQKALGVAGDWLHLVTRGQVNDTARVAVGVNVAANTAFAGWVRVLNLPVCQRCAVLGGRVYRWTEDFDRHPGDDCTSYPVADRAQALADGYVLNPQQALRDGQIKDLTEAQKAALDEGARLSDVVNVYSGMSTTATERAPSVSAIRQRDKAIQKAATAIAQGQPDLLSFLPQQTRFPVLQARLTPEGIYRLAHGNRSEAIRLLRREGYIT